MASEQRDELDRPVTDSQFRAFAATLADAIVIVDSDDRVAFVNPAGELMFGGRVADLIGESVQTLIPGGLDRNGREEVAARRSDGSELRIELSVGAAGEGRDRAAIAVIRDLTERQRHARHLAAQLAVTAVLADRGSSAETAPLIVQALTRALDWDVGALWMVGETGTLTLRHLWQANPQATEAFGRATTDPAYDPDGGLPGVTLRAGAPEWYDDLVRAHGFVRRESALASGLRGAVCLPLLSKGTAFGVIECFTREQLPVDVELRDLLMTVASQVGEHLQRLRAQEELARAQAELERSHGELQHFAHIAAHDLQSPLRTMSGFSELLIRRRGALSAEQQAEFLKRIKEGADAGSRLLENLLAYARVGGAVVEREEVDAQAVVREVIGHLSSDIAEREATIDVGDLPLVEADGVQLARVFQNLICNAIKFTPQGRVPVVSVTADEQEDVVKFSVTDNGEGVDPAEAPKLFAMFGRGARTTSEGSGIGLGVCAKIVARHGGRLWVDAADGGGSIFSFTLPRFPVAPPHGRPDEPAG